MKNRTAILLTTLAIASLGLGASCTTKPGANNSGVLTANNANTTAANIANTANANVNANTASTSAPGSLATPTDAYKTAYAMRKKGDIEGLKKVMADDILEFLTEMGKVENKTLDDMLKDTVKEPQAPGDDVRNEKITGERATLEYMKKDGKWTEMDFVKVGNDWKMTFPPKPGQGEKTTKQPE